jgi:hypothetical protein
VPKALRARRVNRCGSSSWHTAWLPPGGGRDSGGGVAPGELRRSRGHHRSGTAATAAPGRGQRGARDECSHPAHDDDAGGGGGGGDDGDDGCYTPRRRRRRRRGPSCRPHPAQRSTKWRWARGSVRGSAPGGDRRQGGGAARAGDALPGGRSGGAAGRTAGGAGSAVAAACTGRPLD